MESWLEAAHCHPLEDAVLRPTPTGQVLSGHFRILNASPYATAGASRIRTPRPDQGPTRLAAT